MKKKITTTYIDDWDEVGEAIWEAIVEYTHEQHGNNGHIQRAIDIDFEEVFFIRPCKRLHKKDKEKDK